MIRGFSFRRSRAAACAAAACVLAAALALRRHTAGELSELRSRDDAREAALCSRIAGLGPCDAADLEALRARVRGMRGRLGPPDAWDRLLRLLGGGWESGTVRRDERAGYAVATGTLTLRRPSTSDWPAIVDAVRAIEEAPGAAVTGFEMRTSGDRGRRVVDVVSVGVSAETESPPAQPRSP
jgi:hypothetical protein